MCFLQESHKTAALESPLKHQKKIFLFTSEKKSIKLTLFPKWSTFCHLSIFPPCNSLKLLLCAPHSGDGSQLCKERKGQNSQVVHYSSTESGTFSVTAYWRDICDSMKENLWVCSEPTRTKWFWLTFKCLKDKVIKRHNNIGRGKSLLFRVLTADIKV